MPSASVTVQRAKPSAPSSHPWNVKLAASDVHNVLCYFRNVKQTELFALPPAPASAATVPGFSLREDYIRLDEEHALLNHVASEPWDTEWRRRVQRYGMGYGRGVTREFPAWLIPLARRVASDANFPRFPENCVVNEYLPGQGIAPHKDYSSFGSTIACVSLGSDVFLDLTHPRSGEEVSVLVPARSLWVLADEARTDWLHGIAPRLHDVVEGRKRRRERRVSITFRIAASDGQRPDRSACG